MKKIAFLFSGQGAQAPGMGKSLCEASAAARRVFDMADEVRPGTSAQCFDGTKEELSVTLNTQPCLYCVDLAAGEALRERGVRPAAAAGFSLGEIAALQFSGAFRDGDGFRLVLRRAALMHEASEASGSGMAAVVKLSNDLVIELCSGFPEVYPINFNCPGQLAVAAKREALPAFAEAVKKAGGRAMILPVSGGFHSPFMLPAAEGLETALRGYELRQPELPVYANSTAAPFGEADEDIKALIAKQVIRPVLWQKTLERMAADGIEAFVEVGVGKTLSSFVRKTLPGAEIYNVEDAASLEAAAAALGA